MHTQSMVQTQNLTNVSNDQQLINKNRTSTLERIPTPYNIRGSIHYKTSWDRTLGFLVLSNNRLKQLKFYNARGHHYTTKTGISKYDPVLNVYSLFLVVRF